MDFLFINTQELSALSGLPHIQQLTYLVCVRPYMDLKSQIVGIKRKISYQSISEALYVEPHQGIQSGSPSKPQLRRIIKALEQAGLVEIQSTRENLILKCVLANANISVQNKPVTKPSSHPVIMSDDRNPVAARISGDKTPKAGIGKKAKAVIPHNSVKDLVYVSTQFEKFWSCYPQPTNKESAWKVFKELNPDDALLAQIITALDAQRQHYQKQQETGQWLPKWKYPANWLALKCWNDALTPHAPQETAHAKHTRTHTKKPTFDVLWESCKAGAAFSFGEDEYGY